MLVQPGAGLGVVADIKCGMDFGTPLRIGDDPGIRPVAKGETQGVKDNGLAGAGLTSDHGHPWLKLEFQLVY